MDNCIQEDFQHADTFTQFRIEHSVRLCMAQIA